MADWSSGYVSDVEYTTGYFGEHNPLRFPLGLLNAGYAPPRIENACELGFGHGISIVAHAVGQPKVKWFGDDFNPSQALFASWLNEGAGAGAVLTDESFAQFCLRDDLPMFDTIGLHGIWSWVTPENRDIIVDFLDRKLNVGGVAYISYNVMPGWATLAPMRELLLLHAQMTGGKGDSSTAKTQSALSFIGDFLAQNPKYAAQNPAVQVWFDSVSKPDQAQYVTHEYMSTNWNPMYFSQMTDILSSAKLEYACSANYLDSIDEINLAPEHMKWLDGFENDAFRETLRDYFRNNSFRKDYWIKGGRRLSSTECVEQIRDLRIVLVQPRDRVPYTATGSLGDAVLEKSLYGPFLDVLSDYQPRTIRQLEDALQSHGISFGHVLAVTMMLTGTGAIMFAQSSEDIAAALPGTRKLNSLFMQQAAFDDSLPFMASPVTAGALTLTRVEQLFLKAYCAGAADPEQWAASAREALEATGVVVGSPGVSEGEAGALLRAAALDFKRVKLPLLKGLQVI